MLLNLDIVRSYCQVGGEAEEELLAKIAQRVESFTEKQTGLRFTAETGHEEVVLGGGKYLWPTVGPIRSVTSIVREPSTVTVDDNYYRVVDQHRILRAYGDRWQDEKYKLTADVGYASVDDVPAGLEGAMYALCKRLYEQRASIKSESVGEHSVSYFRLSTSDEVKTLHDYAMGSPA